MQTTTRKPRPTSIQRQISDLCKRLPPPAPHGPALKIFHSMYRIPVTLPSGRLDHSDETTQFWAADEADAQRIMKARGMGERFDPLRQIFSSVGPGDLKRPSDWLREANLQQALHAAVWLGMVATSAKVATGFELLNDGGAIHLLGHLNLPPDLLTDQQPGFIEATLTLALQRLEALEARTPGFARFAPAKADHAAPAKPETSERVIAF